MTSRIAIFGGSFNPVHVAHLILAERALDECGLDRVLFVPARLPPHKPHLSLAPREHRLEMLRLAIAGNPRFTASSVELDRDGPSYTLTTVRGLREQCEGDCELRLILGSDSVRELPTWWQVDELVREVGVIVFERPGFPLTDMSRLEERFGAEWVAGVRGSVVKAPLLEVSSSDIRERVRLGRSVRYLVPEPVRDYMLSRRLYAEGT